MVYRAGMAVMIERTTFALDRETRERLRRLAARWHISQAEVVRRAIQQMESSEAAARDPGAQLRAYHATGGLHSVKARQYLGRVREARGDWRKTG